MTSADYQKQMFKALFPQLEIPTNKDWPILELEIENYNDIRGI